MDAATIERFWSKVEKSDGCWNWTGGLRPNGYGRMSVDDVSVSAHRLSFEIANGSVPVGLSVLHKCDNRRCVRPDHLFAGTQAENIADRDAKRRNLAGSKSPLAKLTEAQAREILTSTATRAQLAERFGVSVSAIKAVRAGRNWKHLRGAA